MKLENTILELSLKPFFDTSEECMDTTLRELFSQWQETLGMAREVSVMLWTADGSEILDYDGRLESTFEWCKYIGVANADASRMRPDSGDPENKSFIRAPRLYRENPGERTYDWLKKLVGAIKRIGTEATGKPVSVIATFDPGPEFAKSDFKFKRHPEIRMGKNPEDTWHFVCCYATLKKDSRRYAAFTDGIPDGTSFGCFLGRQAQTFITAMGFDAIWFSNGFGFGLEPWTYRGALFDGKDFDAARTDETMKRVLAFWSDFTEGCHFPVRIRGSNFPTGVDLSSDAAPIREIYSRYKPLPPPNSPWAAMDGNFGIELGGWMSHISTIPDDSGYLFRYYIHDPWFKNSPWLDRYAREGHDIFLPLSTCRLDSKGKAQTPKSLSFLSVDDSLGRMPAKVPREVTPLIIDALENAPDAPGPIVWLHPFDEMHDFIAAGIRHTEIFFADYFVCEAINNGFPLNTVIGSKNFVSALNTDPHALDGAIIMASASLLSQAAEKTLLDFVNKGGSVLLYGPLGNASRDVKNLLGFASAEPLSGEFELATSLRLDEAIKGQLPRNFIHAPILSGGGLDSVVDEAADGGTIVLAEAKRGADSRIIAAVKRNISPNGGKIVWARGAVSAEPSTDGHLPVGHDPTRYFMSEALVKAVLSEFSWSIRCIKSRPDAAGQFGRSIPIMTISRCANAFRFSGFTPDTTTELRLATPFGAPLFVGMETDLSNCEASYRPPKSWTKECRVFVKTDRDSHLTLREWTTPGDRKSNRSLILSGLENARIVFFPEDGSANTVDFLLNPTSWLCVEGERPQPKLVEDRAGTRLILEDISGTLHISW